MLTSRLGWGLVRLRGKRVAVQWHWRRATTRSQLPRQYTAKQCISALEQEATHNPPDATVPAKASPAPCSAVLPHAYYIHTRAPPSLFTPDAIFSLPIASSLDTSQAVLALLRTRVTGRDPYLSRCWQLRQAEQAEGVRQRLAALQARVVAAAEEARVPVLRRAQEALAALALVMRRATAEGASGAGAGPGEGFADAFGEGRSSIGGGTSRGLRRRRVVNVAAVEARRHELQALVEQLTSSAAYHDYAAAHAQLQQLLDASGITDARTALSALSTATGRRNSSAGISFEASVHQLLQAWLEGMSPPPPQLCRVLLRNVTVHTSMPEHASTELDFVVALVAPGEGVQVQVAEVEWVVEAKSSLADVPNDVPKLFRGLSHLAAATKPISAGERPARRTLVFSQRAFAKFGEPDGWARRVVYCTKRGMLGVGRAALYQMINMLLQDPALQSLDDPSYFNDAVHAHALTARTAAEEQAALLQQLASAGHVWLLAKQPQLT